MGQTPTKALSLGPNQYYHAKVEYASGRISILGVYDNITEANQCARRSFGSLGSGTKIKGAALNSKGCMKHSYENPGGQVVKIWVERGPAPVSAGKRIRERERERGEGE